MSETLSYQESAEVNQEGLNAAEQESLAVAEQMEAEQNQLFAGKFKDTQSLEQAYLELQKKLGEPREDVRNEEGEQETEAPEEVEEPEETKDTDEGESLTEAQAQELFKMVGGEKAYQSMVTWAGQNLSKQEISMYDSVMGKGDPNAIFFAVQALAAKYGDATGKEGQLLSGKDAAQKDSAFRSQQELVQAMSDPRYDNDPAYRQDVMRKLDNSDLTF